MRRGFSMIELVVVVAILTVITGIAIARTGSFARRARISAGYEEYRRIATAFEIYHATYGDWPEDDFAGNVPEGMDEFLRPKEFKNITSFGGTYDWSTDYGVPVGLGIYRPTSSIAVFDEMDARYDDGVRTTGHLQFRLGEWFYVLRE
ncbi:MAG: hypothetical protein DHS20C14_04450 [Phycisphaeraceae bacterium]|nr:MAG: hypothetical protein DHS20C14_04450 [Phycisphaeraceae bacterium]